MTALYETYRPRSWADVIGHERQIARIRAVLQRGWGGRAWWISGPSGCGKSTIARLIAQEGADPQNIVEYEVGELTPSVLHTIRADLFQLRLGRSKGFCFIINEAHALRNDAIRALLTILEQTPDHVAWIFTTTKDGLKEFESDHIDAGPLLSRCIQVQLSTYGLAPAIAARARQIALAEGLDGQPEEAYSKLVTRCRSNFRAVLQAIESGELVS